MPAKRQQITDIPQTPNPDHPTAPPTHLPFKDTHLPFKDTLLFIESNYIQGHTPSHSRTPSIQGHTPPIQGHTPPIQGHTPSIQGHTPFKDTHLRFKDTHLPFKDTHLPLTPSYSRTHTFCGRVGIQRRILLVNTLDFPISTGLPISQTPKRGQQKGVRSIFQSPPSKGHTPYIQGHTPSI